MDQSDVDAAFFADRALIAELIKELVTEAEDPSYHAEGVKRALRMIRAMSDELLELIYQDAVDWGVDEEQLNSATAINYADFRSAPNDHWIGQNVLRAMGELSTAAHEQQS